MIRGLKKQQQQKKNSSFAVNTPIIQAVVYLIVKPPVAILPVWI